jgi:hypothetical protein
MSDETTPVRDHLAVRISNLERELGGAKAILDEVATEIRYLHSILWPANRCERCERNNNGIDVNVGMVSVKGAVQARLCTRCCDDLTLMSDVETDYRLGDGAADAHAFLCVYERLSSVPPTRAEVDRALAAHKVLCRGVRKWIAAGVPK